MTAFSNHRSLGYFNKISFVLFKILAPPSNPVLDGVNTSSWYTLPIAATYVNMATNIHLAVTINCESACLATLQIAAAFWEIYCSVHSFAQWQEHT